MRVGFPAAALAAALAAAPGARAQVIPSPYAFIEERQEVGLFAGYLDTGSGRLGFAPPGGIWAGARYGIELSGPLSLEAVAGAVRSTRDVVSPALPLGEQVIGEADIVLATIEGRLKLSLMGRRSWHGLSPFLVFGGGIVFDAWNDRSRDILVEQDEIFDFGSSFLGTAGVGTRWFITPRFATRVDGLFSLWNVETPVGFFDYDHLGDIPRDEWLSGLSVSVSLLFRW
ncbi:MAG TPA: hypothetical protein VFQ22_13990 [Longimicrobiales bacterium]|nr:hypothetical protein [Longimicrobiales bacterium]